MHSGIGPLGLPVYQQSGWQDGFIETGRRQREEWQPQWDRGERHVTELSILNGTHMTEAREPSRILHGSMVKSLRARGQSLPPVGTYNQAPGWVSLLQLYGPADPSDLLGSQDAYRL